MIKNRKGFTLLEAMISMAMLLIIFAVIFLAYIVGIKIFEGEKGQSDVNLELDRGISSLEKDLMGALEIVSAESHSVTFWYKDLNGDSTIEAAETMTYSWSGTPEAPLIRALGGDSKPAANYVGDFELTYSIPENIKLITVKLVIQKGDIISTAESSVNLRNI
ncbi:MAG: prepilin-type N-terminal cleavage/methylation domain-containing protein [Candidatus Saganbacteria bacterium]|nr:prepilin-type N-terminal cleavage/methylation domain-containing protein [Candidatus Saganbacteria bacterium]